MTRRSRLRDRSRPGVRPALAAVALLALLPPSCSKSPGAAPPATAPAPATSRPAGWTAWQTAERLIELHRARRYDEVALWVVPEQAGEVARYLRAVDEFLAANAALRSYASAELGPGAAEPIDFSALAGNLDIFSRYVEVLDELTDRDGAIVTFTVDDRLPARAARFRRVGGEWRYDPGPSPPGAAAAIESMADGLRSLLGALEAGAVDRAAMRVDPALLVQEVQRRLQPGVRMLPAPSSAPGGG